MEGDRIDEDGGRGTYNSNNNQKNNYLNYEVHQVIFLQNSKANKNNAESNHRLDHDKQINNQGKNENEKIEVGKSRTTRFSRTSTY